MIGGSFGTAVFGAVYANLVVTNVLHALHLTAAPHGFALNSDNPDALHALPPAVHAAVIDGIAHTIQTLFLIGVPVGLVAFALSWTLPEIELRRSIRPSEPAEHLGVPEPRTSLGEIQRILERAASRENRHQLYETLAGRAGLDLDPRECWTLYRLADTGECTVEGLSTRLGVEPERLEVGLDALVHAHLVEESGPKGDGARSPSLRQGATRSNG